MNPTEISPSTQLLLDEMRRLFAEHNTWLNRRFAAFGSGTSGEAASTDPVDALLASAGAPSAATAPAPSAAAFGSVLSGTAGEASSTDPVDALNASAPHPIERGSEVFGLDAALLNTPAPATSFTAAPSVTEEQVVEQDAHITAWVAPAPSATACIKPAPASSSAPAPTLPPPTSPRVILRSILRVTQIEVVDVLLMLAAPPWLSRMAVFPRFFVLDATTGSALRLPNLEPKEPIQHQVLVGVLTIPGGATFSATLRARYVHTGLWMAQVDYPILDLASTAMPITVRPAPVILTKLAPTKCSNVCVCTGSVLAPTRGVSAVPTSSPNPAGTSDKQISHIAAKLSVEELLSFGEWDAQQPWPPPLALVIQEDRVSLRPTPWPSFYVARQRFAATATVAAEKVVVAVRAATREISKTAIIWALTHVLQPGGSIILLVIPAQSSGRKFSGFPLFAGDCASGQKSLLDQKCDLSELYSQLMRYKLISDSPSGVVAAECKQAQASWVVLDKDLKQEEKRCMKELHLETPFGSAEAGTSSVSSLYPGTSPFFASETNAYLKKDIQATRDKIQHSNVNQQ